MPRARVLLADDDEFFLLPAGDYLEDSNFDVDRVEDAAAVVKVGPDADVLVVDVRLPTSKCEGIEAVGELLRENRIRPFVPIIFISLEPEQNPLPQAALNRMGIPHDRYGWLQKPFELTRLLNMIASEQKRLGSKAARARVPGGNGP